MVNMNRFSKIRILFSMSVAVVLLLSLPLTSVYAGWTAEINPDPILNQLRCVWGNAADTIYAAGDYGILLSSDGIDWSVVTGFPGIKNNYGIWGTGPSDVFIVGDSGTIHHYDGAEWNSMTSTTTKRLRDIWGISASDIYSVGENGTILKYNGTNWGVVTPPANTPTLQAVWGTSGSNVFAVGGPSATDLPGTTPVILHYDGISWNSQVAGQKLHGIKGSADDDIYAVGENGLILHFDGSLWREMQHWLTTVTLRDIWCCSSDNVLVVGDYGTVLLYEGSDWHVIPSGTTEGLFSIWGNSPTDIYAVGRTGTILRYDGDADSDNMLDPVDNCVVVANIGQEDGDLDSVGNACDNCISNYNPDQEDTYPPNGNAIGDACDCEGNFNCDADVDGSDASTFKTDFGRSLILNPCTTESPCNGDFNCDQDCDGTDASRFKQDFGRSSLQNSCPSCVSGVWCAYQ